MEINSYNANVGDTVFYELHAGSCPKDVKAVDVSIYYDSGALEYVQDSIKLDNLTGYIVNTDLDGEIRFNAVDLKGFQFQADKILAELQFKVVSDYNPYPFIKYEVRSFIDSDMTEQGAAYTYDLTYINSVPGADASDVGSVSSALSSKPNPDTDSKTDIDISTDTATDTESDTDTVVSSIDSDRKTDTDSSTESDVETTTESAFFSKVETADIPATADTPASQKTANFGVVFAAAFLVISAVAVVFILIKKKFNVG